MKNLLLKALKLSASLFIITLLSFQICIAQTNIAGGTLSSNATWNAAGSPYIIGGEITVPQGITLSITPGTILRFDGSFGIHVDGTLRAIGTSDSMILMRDNSFIQSMWGSLYFSSTAQGYDFNNQTGSVLKYCNLQFSNFDTSSNSYCAVTTNEISMLVDHCIFDHCSKGVLAYSTTHTTQVSNCKFLNCSDVVLSIYAQSAPCRANCNLFYKCLGNWGILNFSGAGTCENNIFCHCSNGGADLLNCTADTFSKNTVIDNSLGCGYIMRTAGIFQSNTITRNAMNGCSDILQNVDSNTIVSNCNLYGNSGGISATYEFSNTVGRQWLGTPATSCKNNWWNTNITSAIDEVILDYYDDTTISKADYQPFLTSPDTTAPVTPPTNVTKTDLGGGNVQLTWNPNPDADLAGYKVYWGNPTGYSFSNSADVGNVTTYTLSGVSINDTFAVTAYDHELGSSECNCHESWFSNASSLTGISYNNHAPGFNYFPNPATDEVGVTYELSTSELPCYLLITTINGTEMKRVSLDRNSNHISIVTADLEDGIYLMQLISSDKISAAGKLAIVR